MVVGVPISSYHQNMTKNFECPSTPNSVWLTLFDWPSLIIYQVSQIKDVREHNSARPNHLEPQLFQTTLTDFRIAHKVGRNLSRFKDALKKGYAVSSMYKWFKFSLAYLLIVLLITVKPLVFKLGSELNDSGPFPSHRLVVWYHKLRPLRDQVQLKTIVQYRVDA